MRAWACPPHSVPSKPEGQRAARKNRLQASSTDSIGMWEIVRSGTCREELAGSVADADSAPPPVPPPSCWRSSLRSRAAESASLQLELPRERDPGYEAEPEALDSPLDQLRRKRFQAGPLRVQRSNRPQPLAEVALISNEIAARQPLTQSSSKYSRPQRLSIFQPPDGRKRMTVRVSTWVPSADRAPNALPVPVRPGCQPDMRFRLPRHRPRNSRWLRS